MKRPRKFLPRKGQLQHMFGFLLILIVIASTLFLGSKFLFVLLDSGCDAQIPRLISELQEAAQTYNTFGTRQNIRLPSACDAQALCFVSPNLPADFAYADLPVTPTIRAQLASANERSGAVENVFLVTQDVLMELVYEERFVPTQGVLCVPERGGSFHLRVEGAGRTIQVSEAI